MPFDGNNVFNRVHDFTEDAANAIAISSSRMDAEFDGMATALGQTLTRAGEAPMTGSLDMNGQDIVLDADGDTKMELGTDDVVQFDVGGSAGALSIKPTQLTGAAIVNLLRGHVFGMQTSNGTDADHDIDITAGSCVDTTGTYIIVTTATTTIAIDGSAGINAISTGTVAAGTLYYIWAVHNPTTGASGYVFDTSSTWSGVTKTNISGYTAGQHAGAVITDGLANILGYTHSGDHFNLSATLQEATDLPSTSATRTIKVPANSLWHGTLSTYNAGIDATNMTLWVAGGSDTISTSEDGAAISLRSDSAQHDGVSIRTSCLVNASSQLKIASSEAPMSLTTDAFTMYSRGNAT